MERSNLSKKDINKILGNVQRILEILSPAAELPFNESKSRTKTTHNDVEEIIGAISILLLNKKIFETNKDIINFGSKVNIIIPNEDSKQREDLIGWIISSISKFEKNDLDKIKYLIKEIKSVSKTDKSNFFKDWGTVIKEINL
jgi:hypothetical protein